MPETSPHQPMPETSSETGDKDWLKELGSKETRQLVLSYILNKRMGFSLADAEDITQQALSKAVKAIKAGQFRGIERFKGTSSLMPWLFRITKNTALDLLDRKKFTDKTIPLSDIYKLAKDEPTSEEELITAETIKNLNRYFNNLPPKLKKVVELRAEGLNNKQIAEQLGVGLNTIKSRMRYAIEYLQKELREEDKK